MRSNAPQVWQRTTLGDVLTLKRGYDLPTQNRVPGPVPIISSSGTTGFHDTPMVSAPGVVTGRYGTIGQVFFIDCDFWPLNTALYVTDFKRNHPQYCAALLRTLNFHAYDGKSGVPGINRNDLHTIEVVIPPVNEQRAIAATLGALDDKIDSNRRLVRLLERTAAELFRARFVDFVGVEEFEESEVGRIPRGWQAGFLDDLATSTKMTVQPSASPAASFEHFSIGAFDDGRASVLEKGGAMLSAKTLLPTGDCVLLSKLNPATKRVWWPRPSGTGVAVCSPEFLVLTPRSSVPNAYLYSVCASDDRFYGELLGHATGTTGSRQRVKPYEAMSCRVVIPDARSMGGWDGVSLPLFRHAHALLAESWNLAAIRDVLLPKLISGAIRVSDTADPAELIEPAREQVAIKP